MKPGLGTWRFFLAVLVAVSHLWAGMIDGPAAYAVWGFFVLSGYLMTLVLTTRYGITARGIGRFARNRLVRIYPSFLAAAVLGIATILALGRIGIDPSGLNPQFMLPQGSAEWISNIFMAPFAPVRGLPVPVAAALFVEVWAYALMPLFASSKSAAVLGLAVAAAANLQYGFGMPSFDARYCGFATGLMPFAAGAVTCHFRDGLRQLAAPTISVLVWCAHALTWIGDVYWPWTYGLWVSVPLSAWVVLSLIEAEPRQLSQPLKSGARTNPTQACTARTLADSSIGQAAKVRVDKFAGDLSYPVYLLHTTVGAWFIPLFGFGRSLGFCAAAFGATLLAASGLLMLIDRPMQRLRDPGSVMRLIRTTRLRPLKPYKIHTGRRTVP